MRINVLNSLINLLIFKNNWEFEKLTQLLA